MKELKCYVEIGNTGFFSKTTIILFSPGNLLWSSKQHTGLFYLRCQMTVRVYQSYCLSVQLSPVFPPVQAQLHSFHVTIFNRRPFPPRH